MKKFVLVLLVLISVVVLLLAGAVALLCSENFVKKIVVRSINNVSSTKIYLDKWRFRLWEPLKAEGIKIVETTSEGKTNFFSEAKSIVLDTPLISILKGKFEINNLVIESPKIIIAEYDEVLAEKAPKKKTKKSKHKKEKKPWHKTAFPVEIKNLKISNIYFKFINKSGEIFKVKECDLEAFNISPQKPGQIFVEGKLKYANGKNISIYNTPFKWKTMFVVSDTVIPRNFSTDININKINGMVNGLNLAPFAARLDIGLFCEDSENIKVRNCDLKIFQKEDNIGTLSITGDFSLAKLAFDSQLAISASSNKLWQSFAGKINMLDFRKVTLEASVRSSGNFHADKYNSAGFVRLNQISPEPSILSVSHPIDFSGNFNFEINLPQKQFNLNNIETKIIQNKKPVVTVKNNEPVNLNWGNKSKNLYSKAFLTFKVDSLMLPYLNPFLRGKETVLNRGKFNADILCSISGAGDEISINGNSSIVNCNAFVKKTHWKDVDVESELNLVIEKFSRFSVSNFISKLQFNNEKAGTITAEGFFDLSGKNDLSFRVTDLASDFFAPLIDSKNEKLKGFDIDLTLADKNNNISAKLLIDKPEKNISNELQKFEWLLDAELKNDKFNIEECTVSLQPGAWKTNELRLKGSFYLVKTNIQNNLLLSADKFDCTSLLNTFVPLEEETKKAKKRSAKGKKGKKGKKVFEEKKAGKEPSPLALSNYVVVFNVDINELRGREIRISPLKMNFSLKNNFLKVAMRKARLNKGTLIGELKADLGVPGYSYEAEIDAANIPLTPVAASFFQEAKDIKGNLFADVSFSGAGVTRKNLEKNLKGNCLAIIKNGKFLDFKVLEKLGEKIKFNTLQNHVFSICELKSDIKDGFFNVNQLQLKSKTVSLDVKGRIDFDEELDLNILMGLSGGAIETILSNQHYKVNFLKALVADNFYKLPFPIKVVGTISDPKIEADFRSFMPLLLKTTGGNIADSVGSIIDIFKKKKEKKSETKEEKKERREKRAKAIESLIKEVLKPKK